MQGTYSCFETKSGMNKFSHDDDDLSPLQPKAFFTSEFIQWRVLSIHTNPYQALRCKQ